jgi:transposase-like protein
MFFTFEQKPRFTNCPHCESTDTFLSAFNKARYCVSCHKLYYRTDEARLREQKMDETQWAV